MVIFAIEWQAAIAQLGERQTEDLKVPGSIPGLGIHFHLFSSVTWQGHMV
jgi:hypothetical protein